MMGDGDLDGDLYFTLWDRELVDSAVGGHDDACLRVEVLKDSLINSAFQFTKTVPCGNIYKSVDYDGVVVKKLKEYPSTYLVQGTKIHGKNDREPEYFDFARSEILKGRSMVREVICHKKTKGGLTKFLIRWEDKTESWENISKIHNMFSEPPESILDYASGHDLLNHRDCQWLKQFMTGSSTLVEVIGHRDYQGNIEVCCRFDNGDEEWTSVKEILRDGDKDDRIILEKYAMKEELRKGRVWSHIRGFWLDTTQDLLCMEDRSNEINLLRQHLYNMYKKNTEKCGPNDEETVILGRAYKQSNDLEKNGGKVKLPWHLYYKIQPKKYRKFVDITGV
mmetsp:Transcript_23195/g.49173  ORF Transcript_23195/g.49173 Transcript_23195/m.49173 type:complete len:336 (+) Transcript_23195:296-1303(+)